MPQISEIKPLYSAKGRNRIFLDDQLAITLSKKICVRLKLKEGQEMERAALLKLAWDEEIAEAANGALAYLARAEHSRAEVERRLEKKEYAPEIISEVLKMVCDYGYVDDQRFAQMRVRDGSTVRGKSRRALRYELREKGLESELIEEAIAQVDDADERNNALQLARKFMNRSGAFPSLERKAAAALSRRGYDWDIIREVLNQLKHEREDEGDGDAE